MCRRPIYFRGFKRVQEQWNEDAWETKCGDVFGDTVDMSIQNFKETMSLWPRDFHPFFKKQLVRDLIMSERMFACLKSCGYAADDIDYLMNDTDMYFSKAEKEYNSDPVREKVPHRGRVVHKASRFKKSNVR